MSSETQTDRAGELRARLSAVLDDARRSGELAALLPELAAASKDAAAAALSPGPSDAPGRFGMVGASAPIVKLFDLMERVASADVPVLIQGETGTGKELVARGLHAASPRAKGPFLAENCAAVPSTLLESVLFGHKKGAFTDAIADRPGHFAAASGGTLFLDEIGDMPFEMQAKLLRVLEEREVRPVGSTRTVKVDVRVVTATHRDLAAMVAEKRFRQDLYYRLNVIRLELPPLRERAGDVPLLVAFFLRRIGGELGIGPGEVTPAALAALERARWPGNVRELENEIRRGLALSGRRIDLADLSPSIQAAASLKAQE